MEWKGEYVIEPTGWLAWKESLQIHDEAMKLAYRRNILVQYLVETSAIMGVKVGMA